MRNIDNLELETHVPPKVKALEGFKRIASFDVPEELCEVIERDAEIQRRTFRSQILFILEQHYKEELKYLKELKNV